MEKIEITFWKETYNPENVFVKEINDFLTSAEVVKTESKNTENYLIKFKDIGLKSLYGDINIEKQNGFWITSSEDKEELTILKWNIIGALMLL